MLGAKTKATTSSDVAGSKGIFDIYVKPGNNLHNDPSDIDYLRGEGRAGWGLGNSLPGPLTQKSETHDCKWNFVNWEGARRALHRGPPGGPASPGEAPGAFPYPLLDLNA